MPVDLKYTLNIFMFSFNSDTDKKQANCLRLFALLDVSAEALRIIFDREPGSFEEKINKIMKKCRKDKKNIQSEELLSRNTFYFLFLR